MTGGKLVTVGPDDQVIIVNELGVGVKGEAKMRFI